MPKLDLAKAPVRTASAYPEPYASQMAGRSTRLLGDMAGLTQFGANIVTLAPGAVSSLRHWHLREDEFAVVLDGVLTLVEDGGDTEMHPGDCAAWKAGVANGHRFVNRSDATARFLVVGTAVAEDVCTYVDVDMKVEITGAGDRFTYHDGSDWAGPRDLPGEGT